MIESYQKVLLKIYNFNYFYQLGNETVNYAGFVYFYDPHSKIIHILNKKKIFCHDNGSGDLNYSWGNYYEYCITNKKEWEPKSLNVSRDLWDKLMDDDWEPMLSYTKDYLDIATSLPYFMKWLPSLDKINET